MLSRETGRKTALASGIAVIDGAVAPSRPWSTSASRRIGWLTPTCLVLAGLLLGSSPSRTDAADGGTRISERRPARPDGTVKITNVAGSVSVLPGADNEVSVTGELAKGAKLDFSVSGEMTR